MIQRKMGWKDERIFIGSRGNKLIIYGRGFLSVKNIDDIVILNIMHRLNSYIKTRYHVKTRFFKVKGHIRQLHA